MNLEDPTKTRSQQTAEAEAVEGRGHKVRSEPGSHSLTNHDRDRTQGDNHQSVSPVGQGSFGVVPGPCAQAGPPPSRQSANVSNRQIHQRRKSSHWGPRGPGMMRD